MGLKYGRIPGKTEVLAVTHQFIVEKIKQDRKWCSETTQKEPVMERRWTSG